VRLSANCSRQRSSNRGRLWIVWKKYSRSSSFLRRPFS
jgi:hypothetical protein